MRIGIPILENNGLESEISGHFGSSPQFLLVDLRDKSEVQKRIFRDEDIDSIVKEINIAKNLQEHACASIANLITSNKVDVLLVEGIGGRPFQLLRQNGVRIYTGAIGSIREMIRDFLNGMLNELQTASCGHQQHRH